MGIWGENPESKGVRKATTHCNHKNTEARKRDRRLGIGDEEWLRKVISGYFNDRFHGSIDPVTKEVKLPRFQIQNCDPRFKGMTEEEFIQFIQEHGKDFVLPRERRIIKATARQPVAKQVLVSKANATKTKKRWEEMGFESYHDYAHHVIHKHKY